MVHKCLHKHVRLTMDKMTMYKWCIVWHVSKHKWMTGRHGRTKESRWLGLEANSPQLQRGITSFPLLMTTQMSPTPLTPQVNHFHLPPKSISPFPGHIQTVFSMTQPGKIYHFSAFLWFIVHRNNGAFYTVILSYLSSHYLIYLPKWITNIFT